MARRVLYTHDQTQARIAEMGAQIAEKYANQVLVVLCTLKGAMFFCTDLIRAIQRANKGVQIRLDFIQVKSMKGRMSSGKVEFLTEPRADMAGRPVIIVEDIIDSGLSMFETKPLVQERGPSSIEIAALLDKKEARKTEYPCTPEYAGFEIRPEFVIGYGLDDEEQYRELLDIEVIEGEAA